MDEANLLTFLEVLNALPIQDSVSLDTLLTIVNSYLNPVSLIDDLPVSDVTDVAEEVLSTDQLTDTLDTDVLETIPEALGDDKIVGDLPGTIQDVLNTDQLTNALNTDVLESIPEALGVDNIVGDLPGTIQDVLKTDQLTNVLDTDVLETIPEFTLFKMLNTENCWRFTRNCPRCIEY